MFVVNQFLQYSANRSQILTLICLSLEASTSGLDHHASKKGGHFV